MLTISDGTNERSRAGYARVSAFEKVWVHISRLGLARIDHRALKVAGVDGTAANECLRALRFLGVIGDEGVTTEKYKALQSGDHESLARVIDAAYGDVLQICPLPASSREQLERAMAQAYGFESTRLAQAAAALLQWLYEKSGRRAVVDAQLPTEPRPSKRPRSRPETSRVASAKPRPARSAGQFPPLVFALSIDRGCTAADIRRMITDVKAAWSEAAGHELTDGT